MTTDIEPGDIENELRDLFREKAGEAPLATPGVPAAAPPHVLRRGRRRQIGTVIGSVAAVVVLIAGSVAGVQRLLADGPEPLPTGAYDVFERTATVEAFTVTSPSDWYLVNQWPLSLQTVVGSSSSSKFECVGQPVTGGDVTECEEAPSEATLSPIPVPQGLPMFQLTNADLGLQANACEDGIPDAGAALYVALDAERALAGIADPTIPPFPGEPGLPPEGDGPCGQGRYASFTVNGEPFFAWIGVGSSATVEDRETVETAYERMSAIPDWTPQPPDQITPGYVIAAGANDAGDPWRLEARPGQDIELSLAIAGTTGTVQFALGDQPVTWCCTSKTNLGEASDVLFGAVQKGASGVEFQPDDGGAPITGTIVPTPPTLNLGVDLFFLEGAEGLTGDVVAVGLGAGTEVSPSPLPEPAPDADVVSLSGGNENHTWIVRFAGSLIDETACIRVRFDSDALDPSCPTLPEGSLGIDRPSLHGWTTDSMYLLAGVVPPDVEDIRFVSDVGGGGITELQCTTGPVGWPDTKVCALTLPPEGSGTIRYLDDEGNVLFEEGMGWGAAEAALPPGIVDPTHGGTYWAVYPWIGAPGAPEADEVSAQLADDFGIEAFPGELGCDQGAAEALGRSDAEHAIGVYFETEKDANAFALDAGLLGDGADPVIARVTTFCLD